MSFTSRAWMVAATVGAVEALKDQGFCRWNTAIRTIHQHARKKNFGSLAQSRKLSPPQSSSSSSEAALSNHQLRDQKAKQSDESLKKVMYLSCWGLN